MMRAQRVSVTLQGPPIGELNNFPHGPGHVDPSCKLLFPSVRGNFKTQAGGKKQKIPLPKVFCFLFLLQPTKWNIFKRKPKQNTNFENPFYSEVIVNNFSQPQAFFLSINLLNRARTQIILSKLATICLLYTKPFSILLEISDRFLLLCGFRWRMNQRSVLL